MTAADENVSLADLAALAYGEAARIEAVQGELVAQKLADAPDAAQMLRARRFDAIGKLVDYVRGDEQMLARLRALATRAKQQAAPADNKS